VTQPSHVSSSTEFPSEDVVFGLTSRYDWLGKGSERMETTFLMPTNHLQGPCSARHMTHAYARPDLILDARSPSAPA
jgi:hypothetical protein